MQWQELSGDGLLCVGASKNEISAVKRNVGAFIACRDIGRGISKELVKSFRRFCDALEDIENAGSPILNKRNLGLLLGWVATEGPQYQDIRKDNARSLWHTLFRGSIPSFRRWNPAVKGYEEDPAELERWKRVQAAVIDTP